MTSFRITKASLRTPVICMEHLWKSRPQPISQALGRSLPALVGSETQLQGDKVLGFVLSQNVFTPGKIISL